MKKLLKISILLVSVSFFAQKSEDIKAIKSMCGCYEVQFNFAETFNYPKDTASYKKSPNKHDKALEWVELVEDASNKLVLQHLLIVGKGKSIVKHWRQDWLYENTIFYDYNGFEDWNFINLPKNKVKGQWTQKVYEVDDKPRYEGTSSWVHIDGRHYWENTTNAPLPRREYTQRSDYNITRRTNVHEIKETGWVHDQDNHKIIGDTNGKDYLLAQEKGHNTYKKVEDSRCELAKKWWVDNKDFWKKVRNKWEVEFAKKTYLKLKTNVEDKPIFMHLQALKPDASQEEVNNTINKFILSK